MNICTWNTIRSSALALLIVTLSCDPTYAQSSVVADVKAALVARGVPLSGPCGAFQISKRVAWQLRGTGIGLLSKPEGNNCEGYSVDFLTYPDGSGLDILGDSGGANVPGWELSEPPGTLTGRWRPPFDPGDTVVPLPVPVSPVVTPPASDDVLVELREVKSIAEQARALAAEAVVEIKAHRAGVQAVWLKVSAIAGPILTALLTYLQMRGGE
jgi:hypothetical protein